jgi:ABC-type multidrug transport system fused ATPase/permease subunit
MTFLLFVLQIIRLHPLLFFALSTVLIVVGLVESATVAVIAPIVDTIVNPDKKSEITLILESYFSSLGIEWDIGALLTVFLLINLIKAIVMVFSTFLLLKIKYILNIEILERLLTHFFDARWSFFANEQQGKLMNTSTREMQRIGDAFAGFGRFLAATVQLIVFLIIPFLISWRVMSLGLVLSFVVAMPLLLLGKFNRRLGQKNTETNNDFFSSLEEIFATAKIILGFGNQQKAVKKVIDSFYHSIRASIKSDVFNFGITTLYLPLGIFTMIVVFFASKQFALPISETSIMMFSFMKIAPNISVIIREKALMDNSMPSFHQVEAMIGDAKKVKQFTGEIRYNGMQKSLDLENLTFCYEGQVPVLHNLNMQFPKGSMTAIVGESGAGKSTLIDVIMGFNEPVDGEIMCDEQPLQKYDIISYRKKIGYVPQESVLYNTTITENIKWAKSHATMEEVKKACVLANADEFIELLPEGYETIVGDRGVRLSGGQKQRVALARALVRNPDILILDEATSSLDTKSEKLIQIAVDKIAGETTLIVIAHRLSTITRADQIYVLEKGQVVESGDYTSLVNKNSLFTQMVKSQEFGES